MGKRSPRPKTPGEESPKHYFIDSHYTAMWKRYFDLPLLDPERETIRNEIVMASQDIAKARIRMLKLTTFAPEADLLQEAAFKVLRDFDKFDPNKKKKKEASAFVYLTTIITNCLLTYVFKIRKQKSTFMQFPSSPTTPSGGDHIVEKINDAADKMTNSERVRLEAKSWGDMVDRDNLNLMVSLLRETPIGQEIITYIVEKTQIDTSLGKGVFTLRSLIQHLKQKDFSAQECKQYLRHVKVEYQNINNRVAGGF